MAYDFLGLVNDVNHRLNEVSLTADKFVKKGINKPHYDQYQRSKVLSSLSIVDYITISDDFHASKVTQILKPNYYVKNCRFTYSVGSK